MKRNWLSLRQKMTLHDTAHLIDRLRSNILQVHRLKKRFQYSPGNIIGIDKTSVWNNMVAETTVEQVGKKTNSLKSTGHENIFVSVWLTARGDGTKLKPFVSFFRSAVKEVQALYQEFKSKCVIASFKNAWMKVKELTQKWVRKVSGVFAFIRRL